jgi:hypothetical protein
MRHLSAMRIGAASAAASSAPNSFVPTGLAQRIRVPSIDHSNAGSSLAACTASLGSPLTRNWNSALFIGTA